MATAKLRAGNFVDRDDDPRIAPPLEGDEKSMLVGFLRRQRETLGLKCSGLDAQQLARRAVEPSTMSLLGIVRHMANIERGWFRSTMAGHDVPVIFRSRSDLDGDFNGAQPDAALVDEAWAAWRDEVAFAEAFVADAPSLDVVNLRRSKSWDVQLSLRRVMIHMIEEYARHMGHADLLRERIDGRIGM